MLKDLEAISVSLDQSYSALAKHLTDIKLSDMKPESSEMQEFLGIKARCA